MADQRKNYAQPLPPLPYGAVEVPAALPPLPPGAVEIAPAASTTIGDRMQSAVDGIGTRLSGGRAERTPAVPQTPTDVGSRWSSVIGAVPSVIDQGVRGLAQGALKIIGLPVDVAATVPKINQKAVEFVGLPANLAEAIFRGPVSRAAEAAQPYVGGDALAEIPDRLNRVTADALGVNRPREKPDGVAERFSNRIGQEIGSFAAPAAGIVMGAQKAGLPAVRKAVEEGSTIARMFEPAAVDPGRFIAKEVRTGALAGTGAATATLPLDPNDKSAGHAAADLAGALGGMGAGALLSASVKPLAATVNAIRREPTFVDSHVKENVADLILKRSDELGPRTALGEAVDAQPLIDKLRTPSAVEQVIPGYRATVADRTGDAGLSGLIEQRSGGDGTALYKQMGDANAAAVDRALNRSAPTGAPGDLRGALDAERNRVQTDASVFSANARDEFEAAAQKLHQTMTADARGSTMRAALEDAKGKARAVEDAAWEPVRAGEADIKPLADAFERISRDLPEADKLVIPQSVVGIPRNFLSRGRKTEDGVAGAATGDAPTSIHPIGEVTAIRKRLTESIRNARTNDKPDEARILGKYVDAIDAHLTQSIPAEQQAAFENARAVSKDLNDRFTRPQTAIAQSLHRTQGLYSETNSAIPPKFYQGDEGNLTAFNGLMREAGNDPRVQTALRDQVLADVRTRGLLDRPEQLQKFLADRSSMFERFPDLRDQLGTAAKLRKTLAEREGNEAQLTRELGTDNMRGSSPVGRYLHFGPENAAAAWQAIVKDPKPVDALNRALDFVGNAPEAVQGARASFWDQMQSAGRSRVGGAAGPQPWNPKALKSFLDEPRNAAIAERLYRDNPEQLQNIRTIAGALEQGSVAQQLRQGAGSGQMTRKEVYDPALSLPSLASRVRSVQRGFLSMPVFVLDVVATAARRLTVKSRDSAFQLLVDKAMHDPDFAAKLLSENNPANAAALRRSAKLWMPHEAQTFTQLLDKATEEPDPVLDAIRRTGGRPAR